MADQFHLFALPLQQKTKTCITFKILKLWKRTKKTNPLADEQLDEVNGGRLDQKLLRESERELRRKYN